jgi:polyribonucleotide nucleotidyltransferase
LQTGDKVKVRVLAVENGKLQLSMKPYLEREEKLQKRGNDLSKYEAMSPKDEIEATVDSVMAYGAFVKFEDGTQGLVHISQLSVGRVESTGDAVSVRGA